MVAIPLAGCRRAFSGFCALYRLTPWHRSCTMWGQHRAAECSGGPRGRMGRAGRDGDRNSGSEDDALRGPVALVAALLGLVVAAIGVFLGSWLGNPYFDGSA
jgi:hypothetical protein